MKAAVCRAPSVPACMLGSGTLLGLPSLKTATLGNWGHTVGSETGSWGRTGNSRWTRSWPGLRVGGVELAGGSEQVLKAMVACKVQVTDMPRGKSEGHVFSMQLTTLALLPNDGSVNDACPWQCGCKTSSTQLLSLNLLSAGWQ